MVTLKCSSLPKRKKPQENLTFKADFLKNTLNSKPQEGHNLSGTISLSAHRGKEASTDYFQGSTSYT